MDKQNIFEEINRMKSLFKYEKGRVISEQPVIGAPTTVAPTTAGTGSDDFDADAPKPAAPTTVPAAPAPAPAAPAPAAPAPAAPTTVPAAPAAPVPAAPAPAAAPTAAATVGATAATAIKAIAGKIPTEIGNVEGVKKFQKWLDTNKAGWATGYPNGKVGNGKGSGIFGKRTANAWNKYGQEYLTSQGGTTSAGAVASPISSGGVATTVNNPVVATSSQSGADDWDV